MTLHLVSAPYRPQAKTALLQQIQHSATALVTEYPLLFTADLSQQLLQANNAAIAQAMQPATLAAVKNLLQQAMLLGDAPERAHFFAVDFALCLNDQQQLSPQLIELQAFPSMLALSFFLEQHYGSCLLDGRSLLQRQQLWQDMLQIDAANDSGDTIMLDYQPLAQRSAMSFMLTAKLGVQVLCISDLYRKGRQLFYRQHGRERKVRRIYNRLILSALPADAALQARQLLSNADVSWLGHPDWYYFVSKASMLFMQGAWLPAVSLASQATPKQLASSVCKPLFDFAGRGVELSPTPAYLASLPSADYLLQQKVQYARCVINPAQQVLKTEIRLLSLWPDNAEHPSTVAMMARLSNGPFMGTNQQAGGGGVTVALCAQEALCG